MKESKQDQTKSLLVRIPKDIYLKMRHISIQSGKSLNQYVVEFFQAQADNYYINVPKTIVEESTDLNLVLTETNERIEPLNPLNLKSIFETFNKLKPNAFPIDSLSSSTFSIKLATEGVISL